MRTLAKLMVVHCFITAFVLMYLIMFGLMQMVPFCCFESKQNWDEKFDELASFYKLYKRFN